MIDRGGARSALENRACLADLSDRVAVAMDDPPGTILAPEEVGNPDGERLSVKRATVTMATSWRSGRDRPLPLPALMGRRGPAPTPTRLRVLRGETRPSQVNRAEPEPLAGQPVAPADLDPDAREVWAR